MPSSDRELITNGRFFKIPFKILAVLILNREADDESVFFNLNSRYRAIMCLSCVFFLQAATLPIDFGK